jgi:phosphoribosylaminoimidazolecarboxamide formyltransferase/IMP cyclohydrolase
MAFNCSAVGVPPRRSQKLGSRSPPSRPTPVRRKSLGGRVKTLHPRIHGGILARLECSKDRADLEALGIPPIQLVVVNFYPFEPTVARAGVSLEEAFEQIDIGGPTLARAAAKNYPYVTVLTDPSQYPQYLQLLSGASSEETERLAFRFQCARRAFEQVLGLRPRHRHLPGSPQS